MKDKILDIHPTLGIITFNDLINNLNLALESTKQFEDIVNEMLQHTEMSEEDISSLFNFSVIGRLEWIISIIEKQF